MENNPNLSDTLKALEITAKGFGGFINTLSEKVTPELMSSLSEDQKASLEFQLKDLSVQSAKLSEIPDMLAKIEGVLKNHNL